MVAGESTLAESPAWPFSRPTLMAGLRRYLAAPRLRLLTVEPMALPLVLPGGLAESVSLVRGLAVAVEIDGQVRHLPLVLKEAPVSERGRVLSAVGRREHGIYRRLAAHLPVLVPGLVAGDESQGWIVVEALAGLRAPQAWERDDYREAITNLAALHDRFWGLGEDLAIFPWLGRPFDADYQPTVMAAAEGLQQLLREERIPALVSPCNFLAFGTLVQRADDIVAPLRMETYTLLHGDYWPGNIARPIDGRQIIFDWQRAGIGPAVLDVQLFILTTDMMLEPPLPLEDLITLYREEMAWRVHPDWDADHFALLWDHALLWHFLTHWLRRLATLSPEGYARIAPGFERLWLQPMLEAIQRRLHVRLPG
ncbi:MAG: aminoglycoside phosphotransferase family protein [Anaerolineae bacterium]|nr:aminoglycoside phosphotransferase family protein [Anaerolineae bacterium]